MSVMLTDQRLRARLLVLCDSSLHRFKSLELCINQLLLYIYVYAPLDNE